MNKKRFWLTLIGLGLCTTAAQAAVVDEVLAGYQAAGAASFDAARGEQLWHKAFPDPEAAGKTRSCGTCHTDNLKDRGKHATTGKVIEPLAPSVNKERLTDPKFIEKWFTRNCKWVLGRECTPQEKGDVLSFLRKQ